MKLYEYEGKKLFQQYKINIPAGWLLPDVPKAVTYPLIAKTQVLSGGRGKLGGIQKVHNQKELTSKANRLLSMTIHDEEVADVYVEELIIFKEEYYISIVIDRNIKSPVLIVSAEGGVNIEEVSKDKILFVPINPLVGLQPYMIRNIEMFLKTKSRHLEDVINKVWTMFVKEQAELIEINPLFILENGDYTAGDSKVILDSNGIRRSKPILIKRDIDNYESKCAALNTVGVELEGEVAIVTSGAGLGMATFDLISSNDLSVRTLVDLGGHAIHDIEVAKELIQEIRKLNPRIFFFNFYFQVASCLNLATAIVDELGNTDIPVVIRIKGQDEAKALKLLGKYQNIYTTDSIKIACSFAKEVSGGLKI